ncbi:MAG TPA: hypothetical protein VF342_15695 [Alphaproteobacteria bacterium]
MADSNPKQDDPASRASSALGDATQQAGERLRDEASRAAGEATQQAKTLLRRQKDLAAEQVEGMAQILRRTSDELQAQHPGMVADYTRQIVRTVDGLATALRDRDIDTLISDVEDYGRRQPALFMAGTVAAGFMLARFLKSSARRRDAEPAQGHGPSHASGHQGASGYRGAGAPGPAATGSSGYAAGPGASPGAIPVTSPIQPDSPPSLQGSPNKAASADEVNRAMKKESR